MDQKTGSDDTDTDTDVRGQKKYKNSETFSRTNNKISGKKQSSNDGLINNDEEDDAPLETSFEHRFYSSDDKSLSSEDESGCEKNYKKSKDKKSGSILFKFKMLPDRTRFVLFKIGLFCFIAIIR